MKVISVNWKASLAVGVVALMAIMLVPGTSVREIHNAHRESNFALVEPHPREDDWPWWRGTYGQNVVSANQLPLRWNATDHTGWQISGTGIGHSTPIVWGDQIYLVATDSPSEFVSLKSYHRRTGRLNWQAALHQNALRTGGDTSSHNCATPACDGQFVYTVAGAQGSLWVTAIDLMGHTAWQREAGPYDSEWGDRTSPVVYKSLVIVAVDQSRHSYLVAFHRQSGEIIWRIRRPHGQSFGSPVVALIAGRPQLILCGKGGVTSYDPATGDEIWTFHWAAERVANTVTFDRAHVFATSNKPESEVVCIKADGTGDVTKTHLIWRQTKIGADVPSPVHYSGFLYVLSDDGRLSCLVASNGKVEWQKRLEGHFAASPLVAGDNLYCCNDSGVTCVVDPVSGVVLAENPLESGILASPVVCGESLFLRTMNGLHCISATPSRPIVEKPELYKRRL